MRTRSGWAGAAALAIVINAAQAGDPVVDSMAAQFVQSLPAAWSSTAATWAFLDIPTCHAQGDCDGSNPSSPYGYPDFGNGFPLCIGPSEGVVVFMRTPPQVRYFGFTQYLHSRGDTAPAVQASLGDTLNLLNVVTQSTTDPDVFGRYAVLVC